MSEQIHDPIHDRGQQLENLFFKQQDAKLLERIRQESENKEQREQLQHASGISDQAALDGLVAVGVTADSLTSVSLIPLVAVAWADRRMEYAEKVAVLKAAETVGLEKDSSGYQVLEGWLANKPSQELLDAWKGYVAAVKEKLDSSAFSQMQSSIMGRAEEVAKAAGGFLGMGNRVSESEQKVLDELAAAF